MAALALAGAGAPLAAQVQPKPAPQRPVARPLPARPPAPRPLPANRPTRPVRPTAGTPATLPSYPDRPQAERPRPLPGRPLPNRPATLPSYPDRPHLERPRPRPLPPPPPPRPTFRPVWGYHYPAGGSHFAGTIRCESFGGRFTACRVPTRGRVVLERRHHGRCRYGNGWGFDSRRIWVDNNCRATFAYGIGGYVPRYRSDNDAALVVGGVALAAGLVAILARDGREPEVRGGSRPAAVAADLGEVEPRAREGLRACLDRAAANVGQTGGTRVKLAAVTIDALGGATYRYDTDIRASYPNRAYDLSFSCTATRGTVEDFDFLTEG